MAIADYNPYIRTYGFTIIGWIDAIVNLFLFSIVIAEKRIRSGYAILVLAFFIHGFCGTAAGVSGIYRFTLVNNPNKVIESKHCFYESTAFIELWASQAVTTVMVANSIDRLFVVMDPIYYFAHQARFTRSFIFIVFLVPTLMCGTATIAEMTKPTRIVDRACIAQYLFTAPALTYMDLIRTFSALASIILMTIVTTIMNKRQSEIAKFREAHGGEKNKDFLNKKQRNYITSALICNLTTLTLYVIPMICQFALEEAEVSWIGTMKLYVLVFTYINQLNIALIFVPSQDDIRICCLNKTIYRCTGKKADMNGCVTTVASVTRVRKKNTTNAATTTIIR